MRGLGGGNGVVECWSNGGKGIEDEEEREEANGVVE